MRKFVIIIGVLVALLIGFIALNLFSGGSSGRAELDSIYNNELVIAGLSEEAATRGSVYGLKVVAANISALITSDSQQLKTYYKSRFRKDPKVVKFAKGQDPLEKLEATDEGSAFDAAYKDTAAEYLQNNLSAMRTLVATAKPGALKQLLDESIVNHGSALEQLESLP